MKQQVLARKKTAAEVVKQSEPVVGDRQRGLVLNRFSWYTSSAS